MFFRLGWQGNAFKKNLLLGMLKKLLIQNYAIIRELDITFSDGMVIITGETGAGKSILMGALGLALGDRADAAAMRSKDSKTVIEAVFEHKAGTGLDAILEENELEKEEEIILRREIQVNGKSRSFVNDTPVSLSILAKIAEKLVDLHQQFDTLALGSQAFQQDLLDIRSGASALMSDYSRVFGEYRTTARKIATIKESLQKAEQEREYKLFLLKELDELNWRTGEGKEIEEELNMLTHADQVRTGIAKIGLGLSEGEQPMLSALRSMVAQLQGLQSYHNAITPLAERMNAVHVELKDIAGDLQSLFEKISVDDKKMDAFNDRISTAQRLAKKHGLSDLNELVEKRSILEEELSVFEKSSHALEGLEKDLDRFQKMAEKLAGDLRKSRQAEIPQLEENTQLLLKRVGMPNAALKIALKPVELSASGIDLVEFLFDANKSGQFESLQKVASGGELSRLMLVLKSLVADSMEMPTLIFDEIDSGISGEAAKQVGMLMEELSANHQLIAITHQPQIAAKAEQHLFVYKKEENGQINTGIRMLSQEERVQAIAQMLAGENPSEAVMASAREMMKKG
ncbi:MAG: DNA repair protein RecN [Chitinophagia bacterium]|jgi:DNA repair protein RecN (Recombination protein N)|nr:DNA repair protein RecN [Chitinophagia bacterium]